MTTLYYVAIILRRRVSYRALSLRYACIRNSGIILISLATFVSNFVSFTAFTAELAHVEKQCILYHSPSLFDTPGTKAQVELLSFLA